jgi:hypothetical protein
MWKRDICRVLRAVSKSKAEVRQGRVEVLGFDGQKKAQQRRVLKYRDKRSDKDLIPSFLSVDGDFYWSRNLRGTN